MPDNDQCEYKIESILAFLINSKDKSHKFLISLGILINSGGIIGISTIIKDKPTGELKWSLLSFITSILLIFLVEFLNLKALTDSMKRLYEKGSFQSRNPMLSSIELQNLHVYSTSHHKLI